MTKTKKEEEREEIEIEKEEEEVVGTPISGHSDYDPDLPDNKQRGLR